MPHALDKSEIAEGAATDVGVARHTATGYRASAAECLDDPSDWGLPVALPFWRSSGPAAPISPASLQRACARNAREKVSLLREQMRLTVRLKDGQAPTNHIQSSTGLCKGEALLHELSGLVLVPFGKGAIRAPRARALPTALAVALICVQASLDARSLRPASSPLRIVAAVAARPCTACTSEPGSLVRPSSCLTYRCSTSQQTTRVPRETKHCYSPRSAHLSPAASVSTCVCCGGLRIRPARRGKCSSALVRARGRIESIMRFSSDARRRAGCRRGAHLWSRQQQPLPSLWLCCRLVTRRIAARGIGEGCQRQAVAG